MARRAMRKLTPAVFRLESREVLSRVAPVGHSLGSPRPAAIVAPASAAHPLATTAPVPTPQELARERYVAVATRIQVGEAGPRFTDQKAQFLYAGSGGSNRNVALRLVMRLYTPLDPTAPVTGLASVRNRDVATTGTNLILDLTGSTANLDAFGRPTHLTWTVDGSSGGSYAGAVAVNPDGTPGVGTLDITYSGNPNHAPHGGVNAGSANAILRGFIQTNNGVTQVTSFEIGHF
jgi:hypothetical protein